MDETHLSSEGAAAMTKRFCQIAAATGEGKDVSSWFYSSYEELKQDSPYTIFLK